MKKGFTIIELLVASLLLGMLCTVLTMLFNQSSIAWRTGVASVADMDDVRKDIASIREEADNLIVDPDSDQKMYMLLSPWDMNGNLRNRAVNSNDLNSPDKQKYWLSSLLLYGQASYLTRENLKPSDFSLINCGASESAEKTYSYTVGVTSAGPDRRFGSYDDITTWPEEF
jgi:prepilin-type N-terminal cleavage/methylation domain-containing protein